MSQQVAIKLRIPVDAGWQAGDRLQVFTDFGSGTIDTTQPLLTQQLRMFPKALAERGAGLGGAGGLSAGGIRQRLLRSGGAGDHAAGQESAGGGTALIEATVYVDQAFGAWKFAARAVDDAGNVQGAALAEVTHLVSGEDPPPLSAFTFTSYDGPSDVATFGFTV